jgi:hypothetical protein
MHDTHAVTGGDAQLVESMHSLHPRIREMQAMHRSGRSAGPEGHDMHGPHA